MFHKSIKYYPFLLIFMLLQSVRGQEIPFVNYSIEDGLPQNTVYDITEDHLGYIWFATQIGVARFDGENFVNYSIEDGLPENEVKTLYTDRSGHVWVGTPNGGLAKITPSGVEMVVEANSLISGAVNQIMEDRFSHVLVGTETDGLYVFNADTLYTHIAYIGEEKKLVQDMLEVEGKLWIAGYDGILSLSVETFDSLGYIPIDKVVRSLDVGIDNEIWAATQGKGMFCIKEGEVKQFDEHSGLTDSILLSLFTDSQGKVWIGNYPQGISVYDGTFVSEHFVDSEEAVVVRSFHEDQKGRVWILTYGNGVFLYQNNNYYHYTTENQLADDNMLSWFEDSNGNIWLGSEQNGVSKLGKGIFEIYTGQAGVSLKSVAGDMYDHVRMKDNSVLDVASHPNGDLWLGFSEQLLRFDGYRFVEISEQFLRHYQSISETPPSVQPSISTIHISSDGTVWLGTYKGSLHQYKNERFARGFLGKTEEAFSSGFVSDITEDASGKLWIATDKGLYAYDQGSFVKYTREEGLADDNVQSVVAYKNRLYCTTSRGLSILNQSDTTFFNIGTDQGLPIDDCGDLLFDPSGNIWLGTYGGGVCLLQPEEDNSRYKIEVFNESRGLTSNNTLSLVLDDQGLLWVGHEKGLNTIDIDTREINTYGREEGFLPIECNYQASTRDIFGNIWIGTIDGLVKCYPQRTLPNTNPPQSFLSQIVVFDTLALDYTEYAETLDEQTGLPLNLVIPYKMNYLSFHTVVNHMVIPERNQLMAKLEGYDPDWSIPSTERIFEYKKLPPKRYALLLRAANSDGVWQEDAFRFEFRIKPPFWKTPWFYALELLAVLALIYAFIKYRERQLIREKRVLEEKVRIRTQEIQEQKQEIELQRDEIAIKNKEITDSIHYAKRIQNAVLPKPEDLDRMLPEHFIFFRPRDIVSGDFFWVNEVGSKVIVVAADCTGHGVPGAFMSMLGVTLLNETVNKDQIHEADRILGQLREYIKQTLSQTGKEGESKDGMDLALTIIDREKNTLEYSGAYNPLVHVRNGELNEIKADKMPIGIHLRDAQPFTIHTLDLEKGDMIYIFSDGYPDQFGGEKGMKYKAVPFKRYLTSIAELPMNEQEKALGDELDRWMGAEDQIDDIIVVGIRIT